MEPSRRSLKLMIAEDNRDDRTLMVRAMHEAGFEKRAIFFEGGGSLLGYLLGEGKGGPEEARPDLIMLDLHMPHGDGCSALERLRADEAWSKIPVVIFTGYADEAELRRCQDMGASACLIKPGSYDELVKMMGALREYAERELERDPALSGLGAWLTGAKGLT